MMSTLGAKPRTTMHNDQAPTEGTCKLTGKTGPFVASHIIPEALTRPSVRGRPLFQYEEGRPPTRRWTSWYDSALVTADGERYLSDLDSWAISELRKHRLVWSGWRGDQQLGELNTIFFKSLGIRSVENMDTKRLRLFFHSLLWRAAASDRDEFSEITVSPEDLAVLRDEVLGSLESPLSFFPVQLTQLSTKGVVHNHAPIRDVKYLPNPYMPNGSPVALPTFRFYFDGLIAHVHCATPLGYGCEALGDLLLGSSTSVVISTIPFEDSAQALNLSKVLSESDARFAPPDGFVA